MKIAKKYTDNLNNAIQKYIEFFCKKQEIEFEYWISNEIGSTAAFGDYFFNFGDIKNDIETEQPEGKILEWHDANSDFNLMTEPAERLHINYTAWCNGLRFEDLKTTK